MPFDHGFALLIGVGTYAHIPWANVPITHNDAQKVQEVLFDPERCGYPKSQVTLLHDQTATHKGVITALETLKNETKDEDTVFIFYSGHGEYGTDGDYYLTTHDTTLDSKYKVEKGAGISERNLIDELRQIPAKRLMLILNACHSGAVSPSLDLDEPKKLFGSVPAPEKSLDAVLSTGEGRIIITACRPEQKSWIGNGTTTIFANSLIEGLSGGGYVMNNNGYVSAFSLYEHIFLKVKESADKLGELQEPELSILKNVGPFPVAIYRGATSLGDFTSERVPPGTATREVSPELSRRMFNRYTSINIERMNGGFIQSDWTVKGDVKQAGRDYYDGTAKTPKDEGSE
jgi:hypothetical protein